MLPRYALPATVAATHNAAKSKQSLGPRGSFVVLVLALIAIAIALMSAGCSTQKDVKLPPIKGAVCYIKDGVAGCVGTDGKTITTRIEVKDGESAEEGEKHSKKKH